jgi:predicted hotdog family 3-hydroxylacyl-ACP dehydratase
MTEAEDKPIDREELLTLVPHRGRMFLLSRILSRDMKNHSLVCEYDVTEESLFYKEDLKGIDSWVGFELMAQGISALSGLQSRACGRPPRYGFILSVSDMALYIPVLAGTVRIEVEEETMVDMVYVFRCRVFSGGKSAVEAKLIVMEAKDVSFLIKDT